MREKKTLEAPSVLSPPERSNKVYEPTQNWKWSHWKQPPGKLHKEPPPPPAPGPRLPEHSSWGVRHKNQPGKPNTHSPVGQMLTAASQ